METTADRYNSAVNQIEKSNEKIEEAKTLQQDMERVFSKVSSGAKMTASDTSEYNATLDKLAQVSPEARKAVDNLKDGLIDQAEAARILKEE